MRAAEGASFRRSCYIVCGAVWISIDVGRAADREISVPSFDLAAIPSGVTRPLTVAVAHIPILILAIAALPVWMLAMLLPSSHGEHALRVVRELSTWSRDITTAVCGGRTR